MNIDLFCRLIMWFVAFIVAMYVILLLVLEFMAIREAYLECKKGEEKHANILGVAQGIQIFDNIPDHPADEKYKDLMGNINDVNHYKNLCLTLQKENARLQSLSNSQLGDIALYRQRIENFQGAQDARSLQQRIDELK